MGKINLFREDLELNKKWWHRLFKILFIVSLLIFIWKFYLIFLEESANHYKKVAELEDRLTDKVLKIEDLLKYWEKFMDSGWWTKENYWNKNIYCSNKLYDTENIKYIINETWIDNFDRLYINKNNTSIKNFSDLIKNNDIKCIIKDNAEVDFLNPMKEFNEFWFYKKSQFQYLIDSVFLWQFLINLLLYIILIYIFYYWIIMYIFYWKKSSD